ncbi:hypothetical protein FIBSPDRAFT_1040024 [Athelia psychrophila]|uniref:Uncharacterized protein n=1 Tax=Athelia psychrophila TaxID=1759441 RepID=A0A166R0E4_9AGAM|nr:hypothetical protein FIBSPDRAFT_1040024 [Fibularhizoctonia sp. CBS 109695]
MHVDKAPERDRVNNLDVSRPPAAAVLCCVYIIFVMDPLTPKRRRTDQPYKIKFKSTLTPQIHPSQTPGYSSKTWATPQDQNDMLPVFASPETTTPRAPFSAFAAPWVPQGPLESPSNPPRTSTKQTHCNLDTENVAPSGGASTRSSKQARMDELDEEIKCVSAELARLRGAREELRGTLGTRKYAPRQTVSEKLDKVIQFLWDACKWSISAFLWHFSKLKDENGEDYHREHKHAEAMARFLQGRCKYTPAAIIDAWMCSPDGCAPDDLELMYSTTTAFTDINR